MNIEAGSIIKSTRALDGSVFENVTVFIAESNEKGAIGFVVNKIFERPLNALQEFSYLPYFDLYAGGPVEKEHLFFIHRRPDIIEGGEKICDGILLGGNFKQAAAGINEFLITGADIKIFIGYCGWDYQELEAEIAEGSWEITSEAANSIFTK